MHGRLKVRTTEEQKLIKQKEQQKKLAAYKHVLNQVSLARNEVPYDRTSFSLSAQILTVNPDVYTLWNYRKEVILQEIEESKKNEEEGEERLITFLENEIKLTEHCLLNNPKSYTSWHHRYWVLLYHPKPNWQQEFSLCTKYLQYDDRNFHCWDHRRLILNKVGITLAKEIEFSSDKLNDNFSNYSSWHYRSTLRKLDGDTLDREIELVQSAIFTDPTDSSAWFYLRWVLSNPDATKEHLERLLEACDQLFELDPDCKWILMTKCWLTGSLSLNDKTFVDKRVEYYQKLEELDPMRKGQYEDYLKAAKRSLGLGE